LKHSKNIGNLQFDIVSDYHNDYRDERFHLWQKRNPKRNQTSHVRIFRSVPANNGQWCRKIKGRIHYFGVWANPEAAEQEYLRQKEYLQAGRLPPAKTATGVTMADLCNKFLNAKRALRDTGELSGRTFNDYHAACAEFWITSARNDWCEDCGPDDFQHIAQNSARCSVCMASRNG
jgi:hypothetical protein